VSERGEANKEVVRRAFEEVWNERRPEAIEELFAPDFVFHSPAEPEPIRGLDGYKQFVARIRGGFPDVRVHVDDMIAEGDVVAVRVTMEMTHTGVYQGIPPAGKRLRATQMFFDRMADGKIAESWQEVDALRILTELGVVPPPGLGPAGLIAWAFRTVGRFALLQARHARRGR
jgi:steroid delta-isomerase-like uncharacterized protein